jgi:hypothetical protein
MFTWTIYCLGNLFAQQYVSLTFCCVHKRYVIQQFVIWQLVIWQLVIWQLVIWQLVIWQLVIWQLVIWQLVIVIRHKKAEPLFLPFCDSTSWRSRLHVLQAQHFFSFVILLLLLRVTGLDELSHVEWLFYEKYSSRPKFGLLISSEKVYLSIYASLTNNELGCVRFGKYFRSASGHPEQPGLPDGIF